VGKETRQAARRGGWLEGEGDAGDYYMQSGRGSVTVVVSSDRGSSLLWSSSISWSTAQWMISRVVEDGERERWNGGGAEGGRGKRECEWVLCRHENRDLVRGGVSQWPNGGRAASDTAGGVE
jgi:hypothetical protein